MSDTQIKPMEGWVPLDGIDLASVTLPNGHVETEIDILELVPQEQVGGAGKFNFADLADQMIAIHREEASRGYFPPFVIGHSKKPGPNGTMVRDDGAPAVAWLADLRKEGTRLRAKVHVLPEFAQRIRNREYLHCSPEVDPYYDQTGKYRGAKVMRVAVTNNPFQKGIDGRPIATFSLSEVADVPQPNPPEPRSDSPLPANTGQGFHMSDTDIKSIVAEETKGLRADLSEAKSANTKLAADLAEATKAHAETAAALAKLTGEVDALSKQRPAAATELAERDATIASLTEENGALKRGLKANKIRQAVELAETNGVITAATRDKWFPGLSDDPVKAFEASPFNDVSKFIAWCAEAPVVVPATSRVSGNVTAAAGDNADTYEARSKRTGIPVETLKAFDAAQPGRR